MDFAVAEACEQKGQPMAGCAKQKNCRVEEIWSEAINRLDQKLGNRQSDDKKFSDFFC